MTSHSAAAVSAACPRSSVLFRPLTLVWLLLPAVLTSAAAASGNLLYLWIFPAFWMLAVPLLDAVLPPAELAAADDDEMAPNGAAEVSWLLRLTVPIAYLDLFALVWLVVTLSPGFHAILAAGLSLSIVFGTVVLNVRHFVPSDDKLDSVLAGLATGLIGCPFYRRAVAIEHHRACATPADPLSARMGENFWKYAYRAVTGTVSEAVRRARRERADTRLLAHLFASLAAAEMLFAVALYGVLVAWAGVPGAAMLMLAWGGASLMVLAAHYVQHYGLLRDKRTDGAYVRVGAAHAWDDPYQMSSVLSLNAGRHAEAHTAPRRTGAQLHCRGESPKLPLGFAAALILATVPPAWFAVMDPRVAQWAGGDLQRVNIDGGAYATLMARYHRPSGP